MENAEIDKLKINIEALVETIPAKMQPEYDQWMIGRLSHIQSQMEKTLSDADLSPPQKAKALAELVAVYRDLTDTDLEQMLLDSLKEVYSSK